jgi:hypothetical protein
MADWLYTGVIDGNKATWTHQTPPLDKTGRTGAEGTLSKQVAGEKNRGSYEAHNRRASSKGAQPRFAARPSPVIDLAPAKARSARDLVLETGLKLLARLCA